MIVISLYELSKLGQVLNIMLKRKKCSFENAFIEKSTT